MIPYLVEALGTFIFLSVIVAVGKPIPIAIALAAVIYFGGAISGGHFNPAVSVMMFLKRLLTCQLYLDMLQLKSSVLFSHFIFT